MIFDIETNSKRLDAISVVWCVCTIGRDGERLRFGPREIPEALDRLGSADRLVGHNIGSYDLPVLERLYGFRFDGPVVDTLVLSRLLCNGLSNGPDRYGRHSLAAWGSRLGFEKGEHTDFASYSPAMLAYCLRDCEVVERLVAHFRSMKPSKRAVDLELAYDRLLRRIERHGLTLDTEATERLQGKLDRRLDRLQGYLDRVFPPTEIETARREWYSYEPTNGRLFSEEFPKCATKTELNDWRKSHKIRPKEVRLVEGPPVVKVRRFNASSPKQVIAGMRSLGWEPEVENESGSIKTSEVELYRSGLPAGRLIAAYRGFAKLRSFTDQWLNHSRDGKLHPRFISNQAATGRSSCRSPNIQQIPTSRKRKSGLRVLVPYGRRCRSLFRPQRGYTLVGGDLKGIEIRLLGHRLAPFDGGDFARRVASGADLHQQNADLLGIPRETAKTVLYGCLYGIGARSLAADLGISRSEAQVVIDGFTSGLPGFASMRSHLITEYRRDKRIALIDGRRIQVPREYTLLVYSISGDAAILMKHWALAVERRLADSSYRMLAVVHDEIQGECRVDDIETAKTVVVETASEVGEQLGFRVPIAADAKEGSNWSETH